MTVVNGGVVLVAIASLAMGLAGDGRAEQATRGRAPTSASARAEPPSRQIVQELSALIAEGQLTAASTRADEALRRYPSDAALHNVAGAIAAQQRAYTAAERHFRAAIENDPQLEAAYLNLGRLYQERARDDADATRKGLAVYGALLKIEPLNREALYQAGYLSACLGQWASARALLERLPPASRARPQVLALLAVSLTALGEGALASRTTAALLAHPDLTEDDLLGAGPALDRVNDAAFVERLFAGIDDRQLASPRSLRRLALAQARLGRPDRARAVLERAIGLERGPLSPLLLDIARVAYAQRDFEGVLSYLARARDLDPGNAEVHFVFGLACIELNLGSEAYESLKRAVALAPQNPYVNYAMGAVAIHRHESSEAIPFFEAYVRLEPDDPRGRFALGAARFYSNDFDRARADLALAAGAAETAPGAHYFLARIARQMDELDVARAEIGRALRANPDYPDALAELGFLQTRSGDYLNAERTLMRALARDPDNHAATLNLAALFARTRDPRREEQAARLAALQAKRAITAQEFLRIVQVVQ